MVAVQIKNEWRDIMLRTIARNVAKGRMKKKEIVRLCSQYDHLGKKHDIYFSKHWREYVNYGGRA
jgi:hypothetical protein